MIYVFLILPFIMFLISSYVFNYKKIYESTFYLILLSLYEAVLTYLIILLFFLQGYIDYFFHMFITIVLIFIMSLLLTYITRDRDESWDIQLETVKNNLLLFLKTLLPLYFFLTIFRFYHPILQVPLSIGLTVGLYLLARKFRPTVSNWITILVRNFSFSKSTKFIWTWILIFAIPISMIFFNYPTNAFVSALNLSDKTPYMVYDNDIAIDADNNYQQHTIFTISFDAEDDIKVYDYYYDEAYFYIYTSDEHVLVYDSNTSDLVGDLNLYLDYYQDYDAFDFRQSDEYKCFVSYENDLLLFAEFGIFKLDGDSFTRISDLSARNIEYYYYNNELMIHEKETISISNLYSYVDGTIILEETVDKTNEEWVYLIQIDDGLFYYLDNKLHLYHDPSISFDYKDGYVKTFDSANYIMYYSLYQEVQQATAEKVDLFTEYVKITDTGETTSTILDGSRSSSLIVNDGYLYLCTSDRFEVLNTSDLSYQAMMNHLDLQPFLFLNEYFSNDRYMYHLVDEETLEYIESYSNNNIVTFKVCEIEYNNVMLDLPFYTHYGILTIFPILIASYLDFTNYRSHVREKSFEAMLEKKEAE